MKKILLCISFAFFLTSGSTAATATPKFADYAVAIKHNMITTLPDFNGRDRGAKSYRTRIINGLKSGPTFAGHFSVIEIGCGTGCRFVYVADNENGEVINFPIGGEDYQSMQLKYKIESRLVVATYVLNDVCMVSYFEFGGKSFHELHKEQIEPVQKCYDPI